MEREEDDLDYTPDVERLLDPPVSLEEWRQAQESWRDRRRRFRDTDIDALAVRLQFGRGLRLSELGELFGIAPSTISARSKREQWTRRMGEAGRRELSRLVRLGAAIQVFRGEEAPDTAFLDKAAAWEALPPRVAAPVAPLWSPQTIQAADDETQFQTRDKHDLDPLDDPDNPDRTHRDAVAARLRKLVERLERKRDAAAGVGDGAACEDDGGVGDGAAGDADGDGVGAVGASGAEGA